jgi:hypothetical protein
MTGKYGVILERPDGAVVEAVPGLGGKMVEVDFSGQVYEGSGEDDMQSADEGDGW